MGNVRSRADATAERMRIARAKRLDAAFAGHKEAADRTSRIMGSYLLGRDDQGRAAETQSLRRLKLAVHEWYVCFAIHREDRSSVPRDYLEVERLFRSGPMPRTRVHLSTHVLPAVRLFKKIREGYAAEHDTISSILHPLEDANARLATPSAPKNRIREMDLAINALQSAYSQLSHSQVAVKSIIVPTRIQILIRMLEDIKELPESKQAFATGKACAMLTALRNRLEWRDQQIAGMKWKAKKGKKSNAQRHGGLLYYNMKREQALRTKRDEWLLAQLMKFSENSEKISGYSQADERKLAVLSHAAELLRSRKHAKLDAVLQHLEANWRDFEIAGREKHTVELFIDRMRYGLEVPADEKKRDYLYGHYRKLYRYIRTVRDRRAAAKKARDEGRREDAVQEARKAAEAMMKAHRQLDFLVIFVNSCKPHYILDELQQTADDEKQPEAYLCPAIELMSRAVDAFDRRDFSQASHFFGQAAFQLQSAILADSM